MRDSNPKIIAALGIIASGLLYYFSNPNPQSYYDYTFRVATNMLSGSVAFTATPPRHLNEFVPFDGFYYSVFPLGSVISMVPFAALKVAGIISEMPAAFIAAMCAGIICLFLYLIGQKYEISLSRLLLMTAGIIFGTFMWTNLTMGGAWQLALGFAMIGELGAIYFTVYKPRPVLAGLFFSMAFGNRTEILLTAPIFIYLLVREDLPRKATTANISKGTGRELSINGFPIVKVAAFCVVPFVLGVLTLVYNNLRFHSFTDFGYARIPGVLNEPWYKHGIFSYQYIPGQIWEMLLRPWESRSAFPFLVPNGFSSSILWSSPFLLFALRTGARDKALKYSAWLAIIIMAVLLWMHGNSGGWQFGYRYAMVLLPWLFVVLLETSPKKLSLLEYATYFFSLAANAYATWLFHWTTHLKSY